VALARSLVIHPAVLLLDEPLGALDAQIRKQVQIELKALQRRLGQTFIYVTHDQEEAMVISDRIAILREGIVEQIGSPEEVYGRPASRFVASFLGECNLLAGDIAEVRGPTVSINCPSLGTISAPSPGGAVEPGRQVWVGIRPERIRVGDIERGRVNVVAGEIRHVVFAGVITRYGIQTGSAEITAAVLGARTHDVGDVVRAVWNVDDTIVIPDGRGPWAPAR
jgi:spermidine/putrescine transport system ATP-binding protein